MAGEILMRDAGSLVAFETGSVTAYALESAQERGLMFCRPGDQVRLRARVCGCVGGGGGGGGGGGVCARACSSLRAAACVCARVRAHRIGRSAGPGGQVRAQFLPAFSWLWPRAVRARSQPVPFCVDHGIRSEYHRGNACTPRPAAHVGLGPEG